MGRIKSQTNTYIYEGETEAAMIKALNLLGRKLKLNLLQAKIQTKLTTLRPGNIYLIIDMDDISQSIAKDRAKIPSCLQRLKDNIQALIKYKNCHKLFLILQYYNLEDELEKACSISKKGLFKHFGAVNDSELKAKIIASQNLKRTLESIHFSQEQFWCTPVCTEHKQMIDGFLKNTKVKRVTLKELPIA